MMLGQDYGHLYTDYGNAVSAMTDAIGRLRSLPHWEEWIWFVAQGHGDAGQTCKIVEIRLLGHRLDVGSQSLAIARILAAARTGESALIADGLYYSVAAASASEVARILDAIFRLHFGIRPFPGADNDYAVGAESRPEFAECAARN